VQSGLNTSRRNINTTEVASLKGTREVRGRSNPWASTTPKHRSGLTRVGPQGEVLQASERGEVRGATDLALKRKAEGREGNMTGRFRARALSARGGRCNTRRVRTVHDKGGLSGLKKEGQGAWGGGGGGGGGGEFQKIATWWRGLLRGG